MLPGETLASGAADVCEDCGVKVELAVLFSNAGFYVGTYCGCGPYTRESEYYESQAAAEEALSSGDFGRAPGLDGPAW